jgi:hypothetical protein
MLLYCGLKHSACALKQFNRAEQYAPLPKSSFYLSLMPSQVKSLINTIIFLHCAKSDSTVKNRIAINDLLEISNLPSHALLLSNQPREARMSDLGSQPREVWKQPGRLPAKEG